MYYMNMLDKIKGEIPPCEDCHKRIHCKYRDVACESFKQFVSTGKIKDLSRLPNNQIYVKLYEKEIRL